LSQHSELTLVILPGAIISTSFHFCIYDAGAKLRRGRKTGVIFLLAASVLNIGGSLMLIACGLLVPEVQTLGVAIVGLVGLLYSCVMFIPPVIVGLREWNRLNG
jgi:ABC-type multidrug transport system permease subunit